MPLHQFVGWALVYAASGSALLFAIASFAGLRSASKALPAGFTILFFLALALHPLPAPELIACPVPGARPNFGIPFVDAAGREIRLLRQAPDYWWWAKNTQVDASAMNLVLCVVIGALLVRYRLGLCPATLFGFGLSLTIELTQLTGYWGYYSCPIRKFDVDDLILNTLGVALGYWAARRWITRRLGVTSNS